MRLLVTGAAGRIGTAFYAEMADRYWFRLADRNLSPITPEDDHEVIQLDIADLEACRVACEGIDTVLHLAADPSPEADFYGSLLDNNIKGTFNVFRAAKDAGCTRVIFASSIHAVLGYPNNEPVATDISVNPITIYGATKCFGEAIAAYFANTEELSSIAVRICSYHAPWIHEKRTEEVLSSYVSPRDLNQLFTLCIDAPETLRHAIVIGQSNNAKKRLDLTSTINLLGFAPQDDGFKIFDIES